MNVMFFSPNVICLNVVPLFIMINAPLYLKDCAIYKMLSHALSYLILIVLQSEYYYPPL